MKAGFTFLGLMAALHLVTLTIAIVVVADGSPRLCHTLRMACRTFIITGTDTGVGKTVLASLLARNLNDAGTRVVALKPISSGDRGDARTLLAAVEGVVPLDQTNPWHFRAPLAPLLAARRERRRVRLEAVLAYLRQFGTECDVLLVESAGGLLTPLGEHFTTCDLIAALRATPIVVAPNRLGAVNQILLVMAALPRAAAAKAQVVLVSQRGPDLASRTNHAFLAGIIGGGRLHRLPWLERWPGSVKDRLDPILRRTLQRLVPSEIHSNS